jgi:ATP-binding cassette, subfamily B, bacterial CvaB/MchF/RaxB
VLENVNFAIGPGEAATIMGPSGCGKTTLMKIMLGLLQPTSGEVFIDGIPLRTLGVRPYRDQVAAVIRTTSFCRARSPTTSASSPIRATRN